jgi:uncharacterized repeat protein (TIGR03803 family)
VNKSAFWKVACGLYMIYGAMAITSSAQTLTTLVGFTGFDGSDPYTAPLLQGTDGNFYGTTAYGGTNGCGTIFKITPNGVLTTLYSFCAQPNCTDGMYPFAGLLQGIDGSFYGTTTQGGAEGHSGTAFRITPTGQLTTLYNFCSKVNGNGNCTDGSYPTGGLVQGDDASFYGTTFSGGVGDAQYCNGGCGTVFKMTPGGTLITLHSFAGYPTEGSGPNSALVEAEDGDLYGTTENGGAYTACTLGCGTVFKITPKGTLGTLHSFAGYPGDGAAPDASLAPAIDGTFYGTTSAGGSADAGTIFKITTTRSFATIYNFCSQTNCADGENPESGLMPATDGNLYGTALRGGVYESGSTFKITPEGALTSPYSFCSQGFPSCPEGSLPYAGLMQATNGRFYGSTSEGGDLSCGSGYGCGTVFSLDLGFGPFLTFFRNGASAGQMFGILGEGLKGATRVSLNGTPADFNIKSETLIVATVPSGATSGPVTVTIPTGTLRSNVPFYVIP